MKEVLIKLRKLLLLSLAITAVSAVIGLIYGAIALGFFTLRYIFPACFIIGAIIILISIVILIIPSRFLINFKFIDHSNFTSTMMEKRENKRKFAYEILYLGMSVIITAAMLQLLLALVWGWTV